MTTVGVGRPERDVPLPAGSIRRPHARGLVDRTLTPVESRWYRPLALGLTVLIVVIGVALLVTFWPPNAVHTGEDLTHYLDGVRRWWTTGSPYLPNEVAGPFDYEVATFLHPPVAVLFFAPWLVLPAVLWWLIPAAVTAGLVVAWRPAPWAWPLIALGLADPQFHQALLWGNSNLWIMLGVGLGLSLGWPAAFILVKPSLAFLALIGVRHRSWWLAAGAVAVACVPFGFLWVDWVKVVMHSPASPTYGLPQTPWVMLPLVAWAARTRAVRAIAPQSAAAAS